MTNYQNLSGLKQHKCITIQFWRWEIWNGFPWAKVKLSAELCSSREALGAIFSSFWRPLTFLGSWSPSIFKAGNGWLSLSHKSSLLTLILLPPSSIFKDPCDHTGLTWIISTSEGQLISNLNSICNLDSHLPCGLTYSQVLGIRMRIFLGAIVLPTTSIVLTLGKLVNLLYF